jgi:hypothetical protein
MKIWDVQIALPIFIIPHILPENGRLKKLQ